MVSKVFSKLSLSIPSSPSTKNLTLHGTAPVIFKKYSTAFIRVISSPLSSAAPRPKM